MGYDESIYRRRVGDNTDAGGPGDYRDDYPPGDFGVGELRASETTDTKRQAVSPAALDDVFDDPAHGEPGRDRLAFHIVWEILLLLGVAAVGYLLLRDDSGALRGNALEQLLVAGAALGLIAMGAGLTLRAGAVNLALGPVAVASALHFAENGDRGVVPTLAQAAVAALVLGVVVGVVVVVFHVPGWAASLAAALGTLVFIQRRPLPVDVQGDYDPSNHALYLFVGVAVVAVLGGLLGTVKSVRRAVGRFRPVADPARRRGSVAALLTAGAIAISMPLAAGAGVLLASSAEGPVAPASGLEWTGLAVGAALLGGTSAYGRRGGIFGTVLAVALLVVGQRYLAVRGWEEVTPAALGAGAIALGLLVTRLVETFGRPKSAVTDETQWQTATPRGNTLGDRTDSWSSLPAQPTESRADAWDTERWNGDR
ncbi:ABC transporter permease [Asanoa sp. WMMD1127]|uniref:ABC transporter permease n=1 Tax=Asanoa sp. WMMD1127 TaxID=3016107 RepID=UPI002415F703|nr:ABC transporter permease [Asanoa sp. WMMD1127]MDG4822425.1 ABC transporter permease [Asanoa sp. WMMD1127]